MPMVIRREGMLVTNLLCFEKFFCHERFQDGILVKKKADENDKQDDERDDERTTATMKKKKKKKMRFSIFMIMNKRK